jgi:hypothetical protein
MYTVQHVDSQMSKMHVFNKHGSFFHGFFNITLEEFEEEKIF